MYVRGIRGATTVEHNDGAQILEATIELLKEIVEQNDVQPEYIASVWVTMTEDLDATFPARAIREMSGWELVPLMCAVEIPVQGSLPRCIRLMVMINTAKEQADINHIYLRNAKSLRPDLVSR
ncbi:chorismate mutase [Paenibacillus sp. 481]|uniref:chorismate mutase n=1 Tax=Paenibacillus sp. 481 TaxID=2835869 RepID=UPI001E4A196C|nr:chorismate mutase [Paenibacillus sp. 481]UHA72966.1 chorismate mutase [Paenibacillus sp. 481]